jgi:sulfate transport system permease protein
MSTVTTLRSSGKDPARRSLEEPALVRWLLIAAALLFLALFLFVPLASVFSEALAKGWGAYLAALKEPDTWSAIKLTLLVALFSVPLNLFFGLPSPI